MPWTAAACAALAVAAVGMRLASPLPPEGGTALYLPMLAFNVVGLPVAAGSVMAFLLLAFLWIPRAIIREAGYARNGLATGVTLVASLALTWSAWPLASASIYRELEAASLGDRTYRLGLVIRADRDNICILCDCDRLALNCGCRHFRDAALAELAALPRLAVDEPGRSVSVLIDERILFSLRP